MDARRESETTPVWTVEACSGGGAVPVERIWASLNLVSPISEERRPSESRPGCHPAFLRPLEYAAIGPGRQRDAASEQDRDGDGATGFLGRRTQGREDAGANHHASGEQRGGERPELPPETTQSSCSETVFDSEPFIRVISAVGWPSLRDGVALTRLVALVCLDGFRELQLPPTSTSWPSINT
jgi:hypothetical protein